MFDADRPIQKSEQDQLGRTVFARYLARCILDHHSPESLVLGLYGSWGSGKTSIINLTLEELNSAASNMLDSERPIILNFSPWSYSGQNQLIYSFFRRLSSELRRSPYFENADQIIHLLELYVSFFTHQPVPKSLRPKHNLFTRIFRPQVARQETFGWESGRDLTQVKAELNELLRKQKHKIIIIMDNIARIEDEEIRQVFQIVKSMGDYLNTIYLLSMDKEHVENAIDRLQGGEGQDYLEKIVQLPFEIPAISSQDLENILLARLQLIVKTIPEGLWDTEYWADLYYTTIKYFFENCRDVTHYINTLGFSFPRVQAQVNPVDFFAISALQVFAPGVYYGIRDNKDLFTDLVENIYEFDQQKLTEDQHRVDEIIKRSTTIPKKVLQQFLLRLFPRLRHLYQADVPFYHSEILARKNYRICAQDIFDIYFKLTIPAGYISEPEMKAIMSLANDETGFNLELWRLNQDERISRFLNSLDNTTLANIPKEHIGNVVNALMDNADLFPEGETTSVKLNTPMRLHRIFHHLLRRLDTAEERFTVFSNAIKHSTKSIYIIVHELTLQREEHSENEDTYVPQEFRDFIPAQLEKLQKLAVEKIAYWAEIGRLGEHAKLLPVLSAWKEWGSTEEWMNFVATLTQDDQGFIAFLCATLKTPIDQAMTKLEKQPSWHESLANIEKFISINMLEPHAKMLFEDLSFEQLREREQLAILIFLDLINAKTIKIIPDTTG